MAKMKLLKEALWSSITELRIITMYSFLPSLMITILCHINWDYELLLHIIHFFVFVRITYHEDALTLRQHIVILLVRFLVVGSAFSYLQYGIEYPSWSAKPRDLSLVIKPCQGLHPNPKNGYHLNQMSLYFCNFLTEYLKFFRQIANYRLLFVGLATALFIFLQTMILIFSQDPTDDY